MEQAVADMQAQLRAYETRLQAAANLKVRVMQAEAGLAQASAIIGDQRRQLDDVSLRQATYSAGVRAVPWTPTAGDQQERPSRQPQSFIDTRAIGKPPNFSVDIASDGRTEGIL